MALEGLSKRDEKIVREMAAGLCSACASDAAEIDVAAWLAPRAHLLFDGDDEFFAQEAIALAGAAWSHVDLHYDDLTVAEMYAECEVLIREGWEPEE